MNPASPDRRRALLGIGGAALAGAALGTLGTEGRASADGGDPFVGAWIIRSITPQRSLAAMLMIIPGGVAMYFGAPQQPTTAGDDEPGALEYQTAAGGQWVRTGFNEYRIAMVSFDYNAVGEPTTTDMTSLTVTYDAVRDTATAAGGLTQQGPGGSMLPGIPWSPNTTLTRVKVAP